LVQKHSNGRTVNPHAPQNLTLFNHNS
jgi:hypothetical protein